MSKSQKSKNQVTLEDISEKMDKMSYAIGKSTESLIEAAMNLQTQTANWAEQRRRENAEKEKRLQIRLYYQSIVMGLLVGIFGNLFSSFVFEFVKPSLTSTFDWAITIIVGLVFVVLIVYVSIRAIGKV